MQLQRNKIWKKKEPKIHKRMPHIQQYVSMLTMPNKLQNLYLQHPSLVPNEWHRSGLCKYHSGEYYNEWEGPKEKENTSNYSVIITNITLVGPPFLYVSLHFSYAYKDRSINFNYNIIFKPFWHALECSIQM